MKKLILILVLTALPCSHVFAWGAKGHEIVVRLAIKMLTPKQKKKLYEIVGTNDPHVIGCWADLNRWKYHEADSWHYVDIPANQSSYDAHRDCKGHCVVSELNRIAHELTQNQVSATDRRLDMLFFCHLMGDVTQPYHCFDDNDHGGNADTIKYHNVRTNEHKLWDDVIIDAQNKSVPALVRLLHVKRATATEWDDSLPILEANISHQIAIASELPRHAVVTAKQKTLFWSIIKRRLRDAASELAGALMPMLTAV